uniref:Centrosomal protein 72 n=1 Tax=Salarias fasciatus TaxID=181472 RepID=A0A672J7J7_SALFA
MAAECLTTLTEKWIRDRLRLKHPWLGDVRTLSLPGTCEEKIIHLGHALNNFVRLKSLDLSCNALVSVEGIQHLKMLERLILYNNCIPSLEEVEVLYELPSLKELDLRLNPLTKTYPHYRPYLVHAMPNLRKLDSCSVRDTERKTAILQFSSDLLLEEKRKKTKIDRITRRLSPLTDSHDIVLNFVETNSAGQRGIASDSLHEGTDVLQQDRRGLQSAAARPKDETGRDPLQSSHLLHFSAVIFSLCFSKSTLQGGYRKPLEIVLLLEPDIINILSSSLFLDPAQAVQILSMMESDLSSREAEVRTLRKEADGLKFQAAAREEEHRTEMSSLSARLEEARSAGRLNEQLRVVLEENVDLQKQLIKLERQYLRSMMKSSPISQIRGESVCVCVCVCARCRSLVANSERLLAELKENVES